MHMDEQGRFTYVSRVTLGRFTQSDPLAMVNLL